MWMDEYWHKGIKIHDVNFGTFFSICENEDILRMVLNGQTILSSTSIYSVKDNSIDH